MQGTFVEKLVTVKAEKIVRPCSFGTWIGLMEHSWLRHGNKTFDSKKGNVLTFSLLLLINHSQNQNHKATVDQNEGLAHLQLPPFLVS